MKLPPMLAEKVVPTDSASKSERDRSFLIFAGIVLVAVALGFKSELLGPGQVWAIALGLVVIAAPALLGYLRSVPASSSRRASTTSDCATPRSAATSSCKRRSSSSSCRARTS
jgi:hypothetical protein